MIEDPRDYDPIGFEWRDQKLWEHTYAKIEEILKGVVTDKDDVENFESLVDDHLLENSHILYFNEFTESVCDLCSELILLLDDLPYGSVMVNMSKDGPEGGGLHFIELKKETVTINLMRSRISKDLRNRIFGGRS